MLSYVATTREHEDELLRNMRPLDWQEVQASSGSPERALRQSVALSEAAVTALLDGHVACVFGLVPRAVMSDEAIPWLLGTPRLNKVARLLTREAKSFLEGSGYPKLYNYVDARNTPSIRWLKLLGFAFDAPAPHGVEGRLFHRFHSGY